MTDFFWLIPVLPAVSSFILMVAGRRLPKKYISAQACLAVLVSFIISLLGWLRMAGADARTVPWIKPLFSWIAAGSFQARFALQWDPLAGLMALVVTGVGFLIHVYSAGYMSGDKSYARYFALLNLFTFAMLLLVMASNIVLMFVGWEGVGLCSYLLIGFWFEKPEAAAAGKKAFLFNRVGDTGFLAGILFLWSAAGSAEFLEINASLASGRVPPALITLIGLLLFAGAVGKSAQIPLYVWLPDAMEGPTPVSALIHAATMVTAGVYMVARMNAVYRLSDTASSVVAVVGAVTALFAATIALVQNDIKRVLAYSTISQIGYMFIGCGVGAYAAGMFHLFTHSFFKSLLFLGAGSVMHALGGETDMRKMGGLRFYLPRTYPVFLIGSLAIAGIPFFSGFFSKDAILTQAFLRGGLFVWILGILTAVMTAFYMFRLVFLTFFGEERFEPGHRGRIHEPPPVMTFPLAVLALFSTVSGFLWIPEVVGGRAPWFSRYLGSVIPPGTESHPRALTEWALIIVSVAAALTGIFMAFYLYRRRPALPHQMVRRWPRAYRVLVNKFYVDEVYRSLVINPVVRASERLHEVFDLGVIDGAVNGSARGAGLLGKALNLLQTGYVKDYALAFFLGAVLILGYFLLF